MELLVLPIDNVHAWDWVCQTYCELFDLWDSSFLPPFFLQEQVAEETRQKIAANNKAKTLASDVDHLQQQVEDEEEAKQAFQTKLVAITQQVG